MVASRMCPPAEFSGVRRSSRWMRASCTRRGSPSVTTTVACSSSRSRVLTAVVWFWEDVMADSHWGGISPQTMTTIAQVGPTNSDEVGPPDLDKLRGLIACTCLMMSWSRSCRCLCRRSTAGISLARVDPAVGSTRTLTPLGILTRAIGDRSGIPHRSRSLVSLTAAGSGGPVTGHRCPPGTAARCRPPMGGQKARRPADPMCLKPAPCQL